MAGRKHHFIQRFLLKGFAFPIEDPKRVWIYPRGREPFAVALEGYGAERDSYGRADQPELDLKITEIEAKRFNDFLEGIRRGSDQ